MASRHVRERIFAQRSPARRPTWCWPTTRCPASMVSPALRIVLERSADIPFIFVSGSLGEERAIEALEERRHRLRVEGSAATACPRWSIARCPKRAFVASGGSPQTALEEQRILLSTLIDSLPEIIYAVDTENRVTVVNRALLESLNKKREEVIGHRLSELWTEENVVDIEGAGSDHHAHRPAAHRSGARVDRARWLGPLVHDHARTAARPWHCVRPGLHRAGSHSA